MLQKKYAKKLYLVHNGEQQPVPLKSLKRLLKSAVACCQYRPLQTTSAQLQLRVAKQLQAHCWRYGVQFIVNNDFFLARKIYASGVHLGQKDMKRLSTRLGMRSFVNKKRQFSVGISCQDSLFKANKAIKLGADLVSFGALFTTNTKHDSQVADWRKVRVAIRSSKVSTAVIGGITPDYFNQVSHLKSQFIVSSAAVNQWASLT